MTDIYSITANQYPPSVGTGVSFTFNTSIQPGTYTLKGSIPSLILWAIIRYEKWCSFTIPPDAYNQLIVTVGSTISSGTTFFIDPTGSSTTLYNPNPGLDYVNMDAFTLTLSTGTDVITITLSGIIRNIPYTISTSPSGPSDPICAFNDVYYELSLTDQLSTIYAYEFNNSTQVQITYTGPDLNDVSDGIGIGQVYLNASYQLYIPDGSSNQSNYAQITLPSGNSNYYATLTIPSGTYLASGTVFTIDQHMSILGSSLTSSTDTVVINEFILALSANGNIYPLNITFNNPFIYTHVSSGPNDDNVAYFGVSAMSFTGPPQQSTLPPGIPEALLPDPPRMGMAIYVQPSSSESAATISTTGTVTTSGPNDPNFTIIIPPTTFQNQLLPLEATFVNMSGTYVINDKNALSNPLTLYFNPFSPYQYRTTLSLTYNSTTQQLTFTPTETIKTVFYLMIAGSPVPDIPAIILYINCVDSINTTVLDVTDYTVVTIVPGTYNFYLNPNNVVPPLSGRYWLNCFIADGTTSYTYYTQSYPGVLQTGYRVSLTTECVTDINIPELIEVIITQAKLLLPQTAEAVFDNLRYLLKGPLIAISVDPKIDTTIDPALPQIAYDQAAPSINQKYTYTDPATGQIIYYVGVFVSVIIKNSAIALEVYEQ